jgi:hypothetical protein
MPAARVALLARPTRRMIRDLARSLIAVPMTHRLNPSGNSTSSKSAA